jgi:hypothetical protein
VRRFKRWIKQRLWVRKCRNDYSEAVYRALIGTGTWVEANDKAIRWKHALQGTWTEYDARLWGGYDG